MFNKILFWYFLKPKVRYVLLCKIFIRFFFSILLVMAGVFWDLSVNLDWDGYFYQISWEYNKKKKNKKKKEFGDYESNLYH